MRVRMMLVSVLCAATLGSSCRKTAVEDNKTAPVNGLENDASRGLLKRVVTRKGYEMRLYGGTGFHVLRYVRKGRLIGIVYWREDHKPLEGTGGMLVESMITDELAELDPTLKHVVERANTGR